MVQYIITPWRSHSELISVRSAFYPSHSPNDTAEHDRNPNTDERRTAVARVSVWVQRGNCPHSVESTALLVSAMLNDTRANSAYAVRAAYSAAFSRFVTGLLDGYQDRKYKMSMYAIASSIGLPATFVELRHQCTHEELPGLGVLRAAATKAMEWIWGFYWKELESRRVGVGRREDCRRVVGEWVQWRVDGKHVGGRREEWREKLAEWSTVLVVEALLEGVDGEMQDTALLLERVRMARALMGREWGDEIVDVQSLVEREVAGLEAGIESLEGLRAELDEAKELDRVQEVEAAARPEMMRDGDVKMEIEDEINEGGGTGWHIWKGPWTPKPIGVVSSW